jgi:hypothetical protein
MQSRLPNNPALAMALTLLAAAMAGGCALQPATVPSPVVGTWTYPVPGTECMETYTFAADGTRTFSSNEEKGTSRYTVSEQPDAHGALVLKDTIATTNGGADCSGTPGTPVDDSVTVYVRFENAGQRMFMCTTDEPDTCFGPLIRQPGS